MGIADKQLDLIGRNILKELQKTGRMPFAELGRRFGLSTPAVMERVRRLEEAGVIPGYAASVDRKAIGYPILAFIGINGVHQSCNPSTTSATRQAPQGESSYPKYACEDRLPPP